MKDAVEEMKQDEIPKIDIAALYQEKLVGGKYKIVKKIGSGSFGEIFDGISKTTGERVAIKFEPLTCKHLQLRHESQIYQLIGKTTGFATMYWFGEEGDFNILVTELLGPTLEELLGICKKQFSLKTVLMIADQMIRRIETFHGKHHVHRDVKPENFLIGLGKASSTLYLIDFGLSKRYRDPVSGLHIPYKESQNFTGTARYASINTHIGIEQSRRDDLESIGYLLIYFLKGKLPWQNIPALTKKEKYEKIKQKKSILPPEKLCKDMPAEFATYLSYCHKLKFNERPDYAFLIRQFKDLFFQKSYFVDQIYDWSSLAQITHGGEKITAKDIVAKKHTMKAPLTLGDYGGKVLLQSKLKVADTVAEEEEKAPMPVISPEGHKASFKIEKP